MDIGTAKPSANELNQAEHHFINSHSIEQPISAGEYERIALKKIEALHEENNIVILTGGSGLFIDAVCNGLDDLPKVDPNIRVELKVAYEEHGIVYLQEKLKKLEIKLPKIYEKNVVLILLYVLKMVILRLKSHYFES